MNDAITHLIKLRAEVVRLAGAVESLSDEPSIRTVRSVAPILAERMRQLVLRKDIVEACKR